jgi:hypothetical protein
MKKTFFACCLFSAFLMAKSHEDLSDVDTTGSYSLSKKDFFQKSKKYNLVSGLPDIYISKRTEQIGATWKEGHVWDKASI